MSNKIVLHLGDADSYSGQAARVLAEGFVARPCDSVDAIETALRDGSACHAVVPLRNSLIGVIEGAERWEGGWVRTRDALSLPVDHCLAGLGTIEQVRRVTSHPAALAQCNKLLTEHDWPGQPAASTSAAAADVARANDHSLAVICSERCAETNGLALLARDIADEGGNETLFALIECVDATARPRPCRAST